MMGKEKKKNKSFADALFLANFTNKKASTPVNSSCGGVRAGYNFLAQGLKAQTWPVKWRPKDKRKGGYLGILIPVWAPSALTT